MLLRDAKRHFYGTEGESSIPIKIGPGNGATGHLTQNQEKLQKKKKSFIIPASLRHVFSMNKNNGA